MTANQISGHPSALLLLSYYICIPFQRVRDAAQVRCGGEGALLPRSPPLRGQDPQDEEGGGHIHLLCPLPGSSALAS